MKIGIDARMYGPKQGGLGRYIQQLIKHLEKIDNVNEYVVFLRQNNWQGYNPSAQNFKKVLADINWYGWQEQIKMPQIIKKEKVDLMHFPHWNVPLFYNQPFVVTIHDLLLLHFPTRQASALGYLTYWIKNAIFKKVLNHAVKKSTKIITPSEFTKKDLVDTLRVPADKISVTLLAPTMGIVCPKSEIKSPKSVLYVGVAYPHKNLEGLVKAWKIFEEKYGFNYQLVLAGKKNYFYNRLINSDTYKQCHNIIFTDYLEDDELSKTYAMASLYVFPSFYEGFGLPPLEAMSHGIPVVSSNTTCLPEILNNAALYFDPQNINEMADIIYKGLTDQNIRQNLRQKATQTLAKYSWQTTAGQTLNIYRQSVPTCV